MLIDGKTLSAINDLEVLCLNALGLNPPFLGIGVKEACLFPIGFKKDCFC